MNANSAIDDRLNFARQIAVEAGDSTLSLFQRRILEVEKKGDLSPVTLADRSSEQLMRKRLAEAFPEDAILGEEFGESDGTTGYRWILDPIDGTKSFISGVPLYSTLVGVEHQGESVLGVIHVPALGETIWAANGSGAWYQKGQAEPEKAVVAENQTLSDGVFVTSEVITFDERGARAAYDALQSTAYITRTWGDAYGYLLVATGRADVMIDPIMNVWDAAAVAPIVREAGGAFTDWKGEATIHSGEGIGASPHVLEEVLAVTRPFSSPG